MGKTAKEGVQNDKRNIWKGFGNTLVKGKSKIILKV